MKRIVAAAALICTLAGGAWAADWKVIEEREDGSRFYLYTGDLKRSEHLVSYTEKQATTTDSLARKELQRMFGATNIASVNTYKTVDCAKRLVKTTRYDLYTDKGRFLDHTEGAGTFAPILSGSSDDRFYEAVCRS
jgi:hypothetical protein